MKKSAKDRIEMSPAETTKFGRELVESMVDMYGFNSGACFTVMLAALLYTLSDMDREEHGKASEAIKMVLNMVDEATKRRGSPL
jgi:hypothetical protein